MAVAIGVVPVIQVVSGRPRASGAVGVAVGVTVGSGARGLGVAVGGGAGSEVFDGSTVGVGGGLADPCALGSAVAQADAISVTIAVIHAILRRLPTGAVSQAMRCR